MYDKMKFYEINLEGAREVRRNRPKKEIHSLCLLRSSESVSFMYVCKKYNIRETHQATLNEIEYNK